MRIFEIVQYCLVKSSIELSYHPIEQRKTQKFLPETMI